MFIEKFSEFIQNIIPTDPLQEAPHQLLPNELIRKVFWELIPQNFEAIRFTNRLGKKTFEDKMVEICNSAQIPDFIKTPYKKLLIPTGLLGYFSIYHNEFAFKVKIIDSKITSAMFLRLTYQMISEERIASYFKSKDAEEIERLNAIVQRKIEDLENKRKIQLTNIEKFSIETLGEKQKALIALEKEDSKQIQGYVEDKQLIAELFASYTHGLEECYRRLNAETEVNQFFIIYKNDHSFSIRIQMKKGSSQEHYSNCVEVMQRKQHLLARGFTQKEFPHIAVPWKNIQVEDRTAKIERRFQISSATGLC